MDNASMFHPTFDSKPKETTSWPLTFKTWSSAGGDHKRKSQSDLQLTFLRVWRAILGMWDYWLEAWGRPLRHPKVCTVNQLLQCSFPLHPLLEVIMSNETSAGKAGPERDKHQGDRKQQWLTSDWVTNHGLMHTSQTIIHIQIVLSNSVGFFG
jgi:hypothetical protein